MEQFRRQSRTVNSTSCFIECLDDYLTGIFSAVPELNGRNEIAPAIESRPLYTSLNMTHSVMVWFEPHPVSFPVASREQSERIAAALNAKGIEARWTTRETTM
ncbi:hypothetical protein N3553_22865 [Pantoea dispersa]|uniref:hypothetical protein n=1 Tax=Pantoea dispersa TaxID=59814 RepID=UPI000FD76B51|nr:hypothetical protein [Pantoea dispersa]MCT6592715.1 hypothetical protein [Pantoea dispersa]RVU72015.1 hypothetical protein EKH82_24475 [Pantoea dispersa]